MSEDWADKIAQQLISRDLIRPGICLILGAADTGKTSLAAALSKQLSLSGPVGIVDADIGQSHIGPPTTVGWAIVDKPDVDFSQLTPGGISFVGDITPVGHLLQLTAAVTQCVQQASEVAELIIIDSPGLIAGPAAMALWWTVQRILKPRLILAVQRSDELSGILMGLQNLGSQLELVESSPQIPAKSPQARRRYRENQFGSYFRDARAHDIRLSDITIQTTRHLSSDRLTRRLVALRDEQGTDVAIGIIDDWQDDTNIAVVRAPVLDISRIRCLVIGDVTLNIAGL